MRISDWSSDVCSSDLSRGPKAEAPASERVPARKPEWVQEPEWALVLENLRLRRRSGRSDWQGLRRSPVRSCRNASLTSDDRRSEEHTSELQSLMRISYAVFCLKKKTTFKESSDIKDT